MAINHTRNGLKHVEEPSKWCNNSKTEGMRKNLSHYVSHSKFAIIYMQSVSETSLMAYLKKLRRRSMKFDLNFFLDFSLNDFAQF